MTEIEIDWSKEEPSDARLAPDVLEKIDELRADDEPLEQPDPSQPEEEAEAI